MSKTLITSRDPRGLHFLDICASTYNKAGLDEIQAQRLNERGGEVKEGIRKLIIDLAISGRYASEEITSDYSYLSGYKRPKSIATQVDIIRQYFPKIGSISNDYINGNNLPLHAEGLFAIPKWQSIAQTYGEAIEKMLEALDKAYNGQIYKYRKGRRGSEYIRLYESTAAKWEMISHENDDDIVIIPGQFGSLHRGRSVRRAREIMRSDEFGLDAFAIGTMLLTHSDRLQHYDDLWIDCAGSKYSPNANSVFEHSLSFHFDSCMQLAYRWPDDADSHYGSASAFLPS